MADKLASFGICRDSMYWWWFVRWILVTPFLDGNFHFLLKNLLLVLFVTKPLFQMVREHFQNVEFNAYSEWIPP